MKKVYFSKLENRYYYGISRTFWHILSALAVLSVIVAVSIVGWSYLPTSKEKVVKAPEPQKEAYPKQVEVQLDEVISAIPKERSQIEEIKKTSETVLPVRKPRVDLVKKDTIGLFAFEQQMARLKNLLPPDEFSTLWNGEVRYRFASESDRKAFNATGRTEFRQTIVLSEGLQERLIKELDRKGFSTFDQKAQLIKAYTEVLQPLEKTLRRKLITSIIQFKNESLEKTIASLQVLSKILPLYNDTHVNKAYNRNRSFLLGNPNDGIGLLGYEAETLPNFTQSERYAASNIIKSEYGNHYNYNLAALQENTSNFIPFLRRIDADKEAIALNYYYQIYRGKNRDRANKIQDIENAHEQRLNQIEQDFQNAQLLAEANYELKKQKKGFWRKKSFYAIAIAVGAILAITLILLMLSMIRNVNRLAQAMIETNTRQHS